ncbi:MAG: hypothetical protein CMO81_12490 [Waddliaceae bacterium]|nr:hypothetical protein [Waddliaceae bacterium]
MGVKKGNKGNFLNHNSFKDLWFSLLSMTSEQYLRADKKHCLLIRKGFGDSFKDFIHKCIYFNDFTGLQPVSKKLQRLIATGLHHEWVNVREVLDLQSHLSSIIKHHSSPYFHQTFTPLLENLENTNREAPLLLYFEHKLDDLNKLLSPNYLSDLEMDQRANGERSILSSAFTKQDRYLFRQLNDLYGQARAGLHCVHSHDDYLIDLMRERTNLRKIIKFHRKDFRQAEKQIPLLLEECDKIYHTWTSYLIKIHGGRKNPQQKIILEWKQDFYDRIKRLDLWLKVLSKDCREIFREMKQEEKPDSLQVLEQIYRQKLKNRIAALNKNASEPLIESYLQLMKRFLKEIKTFNEQRDALRKKNQSYAHIDQKILRSIVSAERFFMRSGSDLEHYLRMYQGMHKRLQESINYLAPLRDEQTWYAYSLANKRSSPSKTLPSLAKMPSSPQTPVKNPIIDSLSRESLAVKRANESRLRELHKRTMQLNDLANKTVEVLNFQLYSPDEDSISIHIAPLTQELQSFRQLLMEEQYDFEKLAQKLLDQWVEVEPELSLFFETHFHFQLEALHKTLLFVSKCLQRELQNLETRVNEILSGTFHSSKRFYIKRQKIQ